MNPSVAGAFWRFACGFARLCALTCRRSPTVLLSARLQNFEEEK
jgi:hypothetical protein